ncbi:glutathione S-transferase [Apiospora saccharicola]|uniref:Glutathione S-transferase n=1 Tax=Apiospora saccharicola TaxID=335842 RepID=A0ABR1UY08_9PEZI
MTLILQVPNEYGYVLVAASSSLLVNVLHFFLSAKARRASGLKYPIPYASEEQAAKDPKAYSFNCAQRAHGNFVENQTPFLAGLLIAGLHYPTAAASLGAAWVAARAAYAVGYAKRGPQGRLGGFFVASLSDLALKGLALWTSVQFAMAASA